MLMVGLKLEQCTPGTVINSLVNDDAKVKIFSKGQRDIMGLTALALHTADPGKLVGTTQGPVSITRSDP